MKRKQAGITLTGFLTLLVVVGFFLFIGMKLFPMYQEYWSVTKALKGVANDSAVSTDPDSIRRSLDRRFEVGYVTNVKGRDIKIERSAQGALIVAEYEVRKPLLYNLDIVGKFRAEETKQAAGAQ
ncbi:DUF4845 domain-containing protein [Lysobacteraceae bacterium NML75-0749]|nr:DUF4845 domain-containing protein [Xanthomonadaceae bacterium NML03-0222]PJJ98310.1 DUF4845 domain-containing protein [Xanthomonadaceae bacterium NML75-0749]PJK05429.1 DUF4845 domain-containing protein [Xanthomonadaceae bacterium NML91-0268]